MEYDNTKKVKIESLRQYSVEHFAIENAPITVQPVDESFEVSDKDFERIAEICNQTAIYDFLFAERLKGEPYTTESAKGFISWAKEGWKTGKYFVFLARNSANNIIGAVDIKSDDINDGEVGYWMDENSPGYMSNIVSKLATMAKNAGYKTLVGYTRVTNDKSKRVLERAGFTYVGRDQRKADNPVVYDKFMFQ